MQPSPSSVPADTTRRKRRIVTLYYDRGEIEVTSDHVAVGADVFAVSAISDARVERRAMTAVAIVACALVPSEVIAIIMAFRGATPHLAGIVVAVVLAVATITALFAALVWPRAYQIFIVYRGEPTRILSSTEEWRALQLVRAVRRALGERADSYQQEGYSPVWYQR